MSSTDRFGRVVNAQVSHVHHAGSGNDRPLKRKSFFTPTVDNPMKIQLETLQNKVEQIKLKEKQFQSKLAQLDKFFQKKNEFIIKNDLIDLKANFEQKIAEKNSQLQSVNNQISSLIGSIEKLNSQNSSEKIIQLTGEIKKASDFIKALGVEIGPSQIKFGRKTLSEVRNAASDSDAINYFQYKLFTSELHKKISAHQTVLDQQKNIISSHTDLISRSLIENISDSNAFLAKNRRITAVASPIDPSDATNLSYLQQFVSKQISELEEKFNSKIAKKPKKHE